MRAGLFSTGIAIVLGSMAAFAVHRFRFFGNEAISFLLVLPIALPGIITGMALNSFIAFNGVTFSLTTIIIGHATFRSSRGARAAAHPEHGGAAVARVKPAPAGGG